VFVRRQLARQPNVNEQDKRPPLSSSGQGEAEEEEEQAGLEGEYPDEQSDGAAPIFRQLLMACDELGQSVGAGKRTKHT